MLQLIHHPVRSCKPLKVDSKSAVPFSFHSLVDQHKAQSSCQDKDSLERDGASNFLPELREALPERLSKNLRNLNHQYLGKNQDSDFGIPTVFVRCIQRFLNTYHSQGVLNASETLKEWDRADHLPRIFLKVFTRQDSGFHYLQLKEEQNLEIKHENLQVVSFEKLVWAFPDDSGLISEPFSCEISPEWAIPTISQVTILTLDGDSDFMPSFQYLTSYFNRIVMDSTDSFSVDVPTLDGSVVTLQLRASKFGIVRSTTVFKNLCSTPEPAADLEFVEGWFGLPGLRLVNYCKYVQAKNMSARLGIVSGSSGIGKSFLVSRISKALGIPCHTIHSADLSLKKVHSVSNKPALLVLDNVYEFYGRKADAIDVLELLNVTKQMPKLLVLALTSCPGELHANLISKVEFHIELEPPNNAQRRTILSDFLAPAYSLDASLLDRISEACPGFLMADLYTLATATLAKSPLLLENFLAAKRLVHRPHSLPQPQKIPPVFFSQIGGLEKAKAVLKRLSFRLFGPSSNIVGGKGALMYGPPGTGKTLLGKALATEASANFLPVRIPDLIRGEIGASEKALSRLFAEARSSSPCIMFLDELDALFVNRASSTSAHGSRLVAQFILELDGLDNSVLVLATTNHPLAIDRSVLRPGRIDHHIYLPPPSPQERLDIFKILIPGLANDYALLEQLTVLTDGFTGADLSALKHRAQVLAYHRSPDTPITSEDVLDTLSPGAPCPLIPSVSDSHLEEFRIFQKPC